MKTIRVNGVDIPVDVYQKMLDEGLVIHKHDVVGTSPGIQPPHGLFQNQNVGGLFTRPGAEPDMYSAFVTPTGGRLLAELFAGTTVIENPEYNILSGVYGGTGENAADFCSPGPKAGFAKLCTTRAQFGEFKMDMEQVNLIKTGGRINRADMDVRLINRPDLFPLAPDVLRRAQNPNSTLGLALMRLAVHIGRVFPRVIFHGNITNTAGNAELGFIREFDGFDRLFRTGYTDIESGDTCPSADAQVINWGSADVAATVNGGTLVDLITGLVHFLMDLADAQGLAPVSWVMAMHPDLFFRLTALWPCSYLTNGCSVSTDAGQSLNVDAPTQVQMRDEMRTGRFLWVNGIRFPVETSSAIEQTVLGQGFSSPIYIIPLMALGAKVTYLEGFNLNNTDISEFQSFFQNLPMRPMNDGFYMMGHRVTDACVEGWVASRPRLIARTPWLAARIENISYSLPYKLYTRNPYPGEQYHVDGGRYYADPPVYQ